MSRVGWFEKETKSNIFDKETNRAYSPYIFDRQDLVSSGEIELGGLFNEYRNEK